MCLGQGAGEKEASGNRKSQGVDRNEVKAKDSAIMANLATNTPRRFKTETALSPALSRASDIKLPSD